MQRLLTLSAVAAGLLALAACSSFGSDQQVSYSNGSSYGTVQLPYTMRAPAANAEAYAGPNWPGQNPYSTSPSDNMPAPYNLTHGIVRP